MNEEIRFAIANPALKLELSQSATRKVCYILYFFHRFYTYNYFNYSA